MTKKLNDDIQKWLKNANPTDLNSFVTKLALEDPNVYQQLRRRFGHLSNDEKLAQLKADISDIVNENVWNGFIDDRSSIDIGDQLNSIIREILAEVPNGNVSTAIRELLIIISSITKVLNSLDDSSGAVGQSLDDALDALKQLSKTGADKLTTVEKRGLIKAAIKTFNLKQFDDWDEERYEILENMLSLITMETFKLIKAAAEKMPERYSKPDSYFDRLYGHNPDAENFYVAQLKTFNAKLEIKALITLGKFEAAKNVMAENVHFNAVRQVAIDFYISQHDLKIAEELALNGMSSHTGRNDSVRWLNDLETIYRKANNYRKLAGIYKQRLFFDGWNINLDDYKHLKAIIKKHGNWHHSYPHLLQELSKKLHPSGYAEILNFEGETTKLMSIVEKEPTLISDYGKSLYPKYPDKVTDYYYQTQVNVDIGDSRKHYYRLGQVILQYANYGNKHMAREWCQQLIKQYPRRSALVDEITKVRKRILL